MSEEGDLEVVQFNNLGSYHPKIFIKDGEYETGAERVYPDDGLGEFWKDVDEAIRSEFSEHIERLKGDYDTFIIREIVIDSGDVPTIKYAVANEKEE